MERGLLSEKLCPMTKGRRMLWGTWKGQKEAWQLETEVCWQKLSFQGFLSIPFQNLLIPVTYNCQGKSWYLFTQEANSPDLVLG